MTDEHYGPSKAEFLATLVTDHASLGQTSATIQRSHRFPFHLFAQIENMARMGGVPVSLIINQLLECGLDAVLKEVPEDVGREIILISPDQLNRPMETESIETKPRRAAKSELEKVK